MSFGKYAIVGSIKHYFEKEPQWWWEIKPVDSGMELEMSMFLAHNRVSVVFGEMQERPPTGMEICFREVAMTFGGTNVPLLEDQPVEEGGEPIISEGLSVEEIETSLKDMPREMLMEIWGAVGEAYPYWGPAKRKEDPKAEKE